MSFGEGLALFAFFIVIAVAGTFMENKKKADKILKDQKDFREEMLKKKDK